MNITEIVAIHEKIQTYKNEINRLTTEISKCEQQYKTKSSGLISGLRAAKDNERIIDGYRVRLSSDYTATVLSAGMKDAKSFDAETKSGIFVTVLSHNRIAELIAEYASEGKEIPKFIQYQTYPVVKIYKLIDKGKHYSNAPKQGDPPRERGASHLVSHNKTRKERR